MREPGRRYPISFGDDIVEFRDEEGDVIFYAQAQKSAPEGDPIALVRESLAAPIGSAPLRDIARPGDRVSILIDDITRPTPRRLLLQAVTEALAPVADLHIQLVIALGTHRPMTQEEISRDLGEFADRYPVVNISYTEKDRFARVGEMEDGTPICIYKEMLDSDVLIGLGNIVPHIAAGWGGGAKIIMPGVCGQETTDGIHMLSCLRQNVLETCGNVENLFRATMEKLAEKVGLSFIVNTVLDEEQQLLGVFSGHFIAAHRAGVAFAQTALCPRIPAKADILIVSANPANADFWQGAKPYVFAHSAVRRGGVMVFLLSAEEGLCGCAPAHEPAIRQYYDKSEAEVLAALREGVVSDILGVGETFLRLQTEGYCHTILVSRGLSAADAALLGFEPAPDLPAAMALARWRMGPGARVGIIPQGGDMLCLEQ